MFGKNKRNVEEKKNLIKKSYALGFEVGYYKHYESVGWVKKAWREIERLAEEMDAEEEVKNAYKKGKIEGERKRSIDLIKDKSNLLEKRRDINRALEAISRPVKEPKFIHFPKFLKRYHR